MGNRTLHDHAPIANPSYPLIHRFFMSDKAKTMNNEHIMSRLMKAIQNATVQTDVDAITRLSALTHRMKEISDQMQRLESELSAIEAEACPTETPATQPPRTPDIQRGGTGNSFIVEIDWSLCGVTRPRIRVTAATMADVLTRYVLELAKGLSAEALEKLTTFRVSRGPLVSSNPSVDFVNRRTGSLYGHKQLPGTKYHVLTHSSTSEKEDAIRESWRVLGLPGAALRLISN
jgi:hypothetical protein